MQANDNARTMQAGSPAGRFQFSIVLPVLPLINPPLFSRVGAESSNSRTFPQFARSESIAAGYKMSCARPYRIDNLRILNDNLNHMLG